MKIIKTDNFNREDKSDILVCENVMTSYGRDIVDFLNNKYGGEHSPDYYRLIPDDYKLYKFEP